MKILHPVVLLMMLAGLPVAYIMMKRGGMPADLYEIPIIIMVILLYYTLLFRAAPEICHSTQARTVSLGNLDAVSRTADAS